MSTARDMFRFARALVEGRLLKRDPLATLLQPRVPFLPGSRYAGGFPGVPGELRVQGDWTLVVLSNVSDGTGEVVAAWGELARRLQP